MNISGLANSVTAILGLSIHGGIPITVVKNNSVCSCQVHTHTPTPSWKDEAEYAFVCIESFHQGLEGKKKRALGDVPKKDRGLVRPLLRGPKA